MRFAVWHQRGDGCGMLGDGVRCQGPLRRNGIDAFQHSDMFSRSCLTTSDTAFHNPMTFHIENCCAVPAKPSIPAPESHLSYPYMSHYQPWSPYFRFPFVLPFSSQQIYFGSQSPSLPASPWSILKRARGTAHLGARLSPVVVAEARKLATTTTTSEKSRRSVAIRDKEP